MTFKFEQSADVELAEQHEINVTPFIDVMLVLLIIFMVAAPLATVSVGVDLPASTAKPEPQPDKPVYLSIRADHSIVLGDDTELTLVQLVQALADAEIDSDTRIFLRADQTLSYQELMRVLNTLGQVGYLKIGLVGLEQTGANE